MYLTSKDEDIELYTNNLFTTAKYQLANPEMCKPLDILLATVISSVKNYQIYNLCYYCFLLVYTHEDASEDEPQLTSLTSFSTRLGKRFFNKFINNLKANYIRIGNETISYLSYLDVWKKENPQFIDLLDDTFHLHLGSKIVDILFRCNMVESTLKRSTKIEYPYQTLRIVDSTIRSKENKRLIFNLPVKLPMLCKPNEYGLSQDNKKILGGYLLNTDKFNEDLFT